MSASKRINVIIGKTEIGQSPSPVEIKASREALGATCEEASSLVHSDVRDWQDWENGTQSMHPAIWELFTNKASEIVLHEASQKPHRKKLT